MSKMLFVKLARILLYATLAVITGLVFYPTQGSISSTDRVLNDEVSQIEASLAQVKRLAGANTIKPAEKELDRMEEQWLRVQDRLGLRARRNPNTEMLNRSDSFERSILEARTAVSKGDAARAQQTINRLQAEFIIIKDDIASLDRGWSRFWSALALLCVSWILLTMLASQLARRSDLQSIEKAKKLKANRSRVV